MPLVPKYPSQTTTMVLPVVNQTQSQPTVITGIENSNTVFGEPIVVVPSSQQQTSETAAVTPRTDGTQNTIQEGVEDLPPSYDAIMNDEDGL